jgi:hypothetical protein
MWESQELGIQPLQFEYSSAAGFDQVSGSSWRRLLCAQAVVTAIDGVIYQASG